MFAWPIWVNDLPNHEEGAGPVGNKKLPESTPKKTTQTTSQQNIHYLYPIVYSHPISSASSSYYPSITIGTIGMYILDAHSSRNSKNSIVIPPQ